MMDLAFVAASWSKDRSRKVGAVIFNPITHSVLAQGYNGFPRGARDSAADTRLGDAAAARCTWEEMQQRVEARHERPLKYLWTAHAELNSVCNAARHGISLEGMAIASTLYPCAACALAIVQSGIMQVITYEPDWHNDRFAADFAVTRDIFNETSIFVQFLDPKG